MKKLVFAFLMMLNGVNVFSCDVCGCSMSSFTQGFYTENNQNLIGARYSYARFNAEVLHNNPFVYREFSDDQYHRTDIFGRINLGNNLGIFLQIPFQYNTMEGSHQTTSINGFGDPIALVQINLFQKKLAASNQFLRVSIGTKFPLGKYQTDVYSVNPNFMLGSGSFDFLGNLTYRLISNRWVLLTEFSGKLNGKNKLDYRFGNQFNHSLNLGFKIPINKQNLIIHTGTYFEAGSFHTLDDQKVFNTGGLLLYSASGLQFYSSKFRIGAAVFLPLIQKLNTDNLSEINSGLRANFDVAFFLRRKN